MGSGTVILKKTKGTQPITLEVKVFKRSRLAVSALTEMEREYVPVREKGGRRYWNIIWPLFRAVVELLLMAAAAVDGCR